MDSEQDPSVLYWQELVGINKSFIRAFKEQNFWEILDEDQRKFEHYHYTNMSSLCWQYLCRIQELDKKHDQPLMFDLNRLGYNADEVRLLI